MAAPTSNATLDMPLANGGPSTHGSLADRRLTAVNTVYSSKHGSDLFKATNKTATAQAGMGEAIKSYNDYKKLVENLYFLLWEGPGSKLPDKPDSFKDVNTLRTEEEHDVDHGKTSDVKGKKLKHGGVFKKYSGLTSPVIAAPTQFPLLQLALLRAIRSDMQALLVEHSGT